MDLKSAIVLFLAIGAAVAIDYCNNMRCDSKPHVACNSPAANGGWGPECPGDQKLINMNQELKDRILDILNGQRNQQALGKTPNYDSASRMGTLLWDDGLAEMAEYNARLCHYGHDPCHNTKKWYASGQNIANSGGRTDDKDIIESLTPMWFAEEAQNGYIVGWMDTVNSFTDSPDPNVVIGHFTQVVWEDAAVVGCAGVKYTDASGKQANLICNFGYGNLDGNYIYQSGPPGSKCKTGTNPKYPGLCSEKEDYSDSILKRSGWDLKKIPGPNGGYSWNIPPGCDDDPDCRELQADPSAFFAKHEKPGDSKPVEGSYSIDPSGRVKFRYPAGCDQACKDRVHAKLAKEHPEYAQPSGSSGSSGQVEGSYSIGPDGTAHFVYPSGCDQACKDRVMKKLVDEHPEYGK